MSAPLVALDNEVKCLRQGMALDGGSPTVLSMGNRFQSAGADVGSKIPGSIPEKLYIDSDFSATINSMSQCVPFHMRSTSSHWSRPTPIPFPSVVSRPVFEVNGATKLENFSDVPQTQQAPPFKTRSTQRRVRTVLIRNNLIKLTTNNGTGNQPIVYLPGGGYSITGTVTIPANSDVQLVGDGWITRISNVGFTGTMFHIKVPVLTDRSLTMRRARPAPPSVTSTFTEVRTNLVFVGNVTLDRPKRRRCRHDLNRQR